MNIRYIMEKNSIDSDRASSEEDAPNSWDSLESDTECLVQEKAFQRELHTRIRERTRETSPSYDDAAEKVDIQSSRDKEWSDPRSTESQPSITMRHGASDNSKLPRQWIPGEYADNPDRGKKLTGDEFPQSNLSFDSNCEPGKAHAGKRHKYVVVHNPMVAEMNTVQPRPMLSSFHLHSQLDQVRQHTYTSPERIPHSNSDNSVKTKHTTGKQQKPQKQSNGQYDEEDQSNDQEKMKGKLNSVPQNRRYSQKVRPSRSREDIMERNKATLGIKRHKQGSYLKVYEQRGGKPKTANQALHSAEDVGVTDIPGCSDNILDPELIQMQKCEKLKIHNQSRHSDTARPELHLNQPGERRASEDVQQTLSTSESGNISHLSFPLAPIINLSAPHSPAEPFLNAELQEHLNTLAHPPPVERRKRSDGITSKWSLFEENAMLNAPEVLHFEGQRSDSAFALQTYSGPYPVLPPIGRSNASDTDLCSDRTQKATNAIHRSSSEGYLAQLQKQLQPRTTYKAYTLKDYRSLNQDVKLGGLGPSSTVAEDLAEKIRRQKLYSNVIREQNKKISRVPFLSARNPVGSDNKDTIPRNKALEYAKTIVRPKAPPQLKKKEKSESERVFEQFAYLQLGVDPSQLTALEELRKRHEHEKQVVAHFTSLHARSSAPSVNTH